MSSYSAPAVPPRPVGTTTTTSTTTSTTNVGNVTNSPDIVTTNNSAPIGSSSSFSTNVGPDAHVKSLPITAQEAPLVKPSSGLMHSLKKAFTTGSNVEQDPVIAHANDTLRANFNHTRELDTALRRYQEAQAALQAAAVAVTGAFHHVLSDERNPYSSLSAQVLRSVQTHPVVPSHGSQLTDLTSSAVADMEEGMQSVEQELRDRKTKQSDVEYYLAKVDKLSGTQEANLTNNPSKGVSQADGDKLERNIGKAKEVQLEYNAENERLIANMNALWRRRIVRLGPALTGFIAQNQIVHQEQANSWQQMLAASSQINADVVHNTYLTDASTVLVPPGSAVINNSQHLNAARQVVNKRIEVEQQQRLINENQQRQQAVQKSGGRLETVQQDVLVRSEEQMVWTKERFVTERVRLRKVVATEMVTITVPVRRERIEIDRIPVDGPGVIVSEEETAARLNRRNQRKSQRGSNTTAANNANVTRGANNTLSDTTNTAANDLYNDEYDDEAFELVLCEERPRVVNDIVPVERIRMKKLTQVSTAHLEMDLLKEHIDFAAPNRQAVGQSLVTQTGTMQTIAGQTHEGFTDTTNRANVVVLPNMVANQSHVANSTIAGAAVGNAVRNARADVDDVEAMRGIGVTQTGRYGDVNTVGSVDQFGGTNSNLGVAGTNYGTGATYGPGGAVGTGYGTSAAGTGNYGTGTLGTGTTGSYGTTGALGAAALGAAAVGAGAYGSGALGSGNVVAPTHPYYGSSAATAAADVNNAAGYAANDARNTAGYAANDVRNTATGLEQTARADVNNTENYAANEANYAANKAGNTVANTANTADYAANKAANTAASATDPVQRHPYV